MAEAGQIRIKRIYDPPEDEDGLRVLVDRLWPRPQEDRCPHRPVGEGARADRAPSAVVRP